MNTVEKRSTGVTPADLILSHAIRLTSHIMSPVGSGINSSDTSLSDRMDEWISRQHTLLVVAEETQLQSNRHKVVENPINWYVLYTPPMVLSNKLLPKPRGPYQVIAHRGDHHRRSSMEFLVRWTGYDASSNSWEPHKALMHVPREHK